VVHRNVGLQISNFVEEGGDVKELKRRDIVVDAILDRLKTSYAEIEKFKDAEMTEIDVLEKRLLKEV
jgi:hypothetical protein